MLLGITWFIRYIYYWNLQFLNNVNINKAKVLLSQAYVTLADVVYLIYALSWCWLSYLCPLVLLLPKFKLFGFSICRCERTRWRLFQKRVVRTTFDMYVLIYVLCLVFFDRSLKHNGTYTQNNFELQVSRKA